MNAIQKLLARRPPALRILSASGQLGYGIPEKAFEAGNHAEARRHLESTRRKG